MQTATSIDFVLSRAATFFASSFNLRDKACKDICGYPKGHRYVSAI